MTALHDLTAAPVPLLLRRVLQRRGDGFEPLAHPEEYDRALDVAPSADDRRRTTSLLDRLRSSAR